ncbi:MAG: complex I NDUFA9 subunit family protein [Sphingomonas sp.]|uniref:complex I NDUFA9 subunit family protein n=1 Tax=Sphingomonas sp. TaxID=28214 RepID=UPI0025FCE2F9|nr:complex I NDUFA9 subunit family protein [Sphingomonas sp.]MBX3565320.1 complex I NDUFA9 subunit family protein [Sphingomonas sp.]
MKDRLVTLIGGGGFLGRYVAQDLFATGARVRVVQPRPRDAWFVKTLGGLGQTQFAAADVRKPESLARALRGSDAVVNLAGVLRGDFEGVHVEGARNVAEAAAAAGVSSLIHISALGADPDSAYGRSKGEGDAAVRKAFPDATIFRPSILFGREDRFVNRFAGMIANAPVAVPVLRGEAKFQPAYVADVAQAIVQALADPATHAGRTYTLGGPDVISMAGLFKWIGATIGRDVSFIELPDAIGGIVPFLPFAPITRDQWRMLATDNVVPATGVGFGAFGIVPTPLATVAPAWMVRFRKAGRFGKARAAA